MKHANAGQFILAASATLASAGLAWAGYKAIAPKVSLPKGGNAPGAGSSPNNPLPVPSSDAAAKRIPKVAERLQRLWGEATGETEPMPPAALELMLAQIYLESGVAEPGGGDWWQDRSDPNGAWAKKNPDKALQGNMKGSGNLGAMQCASCSESKPHYTCVQYSDTKPKSDGTSTAYSVCFMYFRDAEGRPAGDWAALEYMRTLKRRLVDLTPLKNGNAYAYAEALRKGKYYEGFGATQEERIKGYAKGMASHLPAVAAAVGHDRIYAAIDDGLLPAKKIAGIEGAGATVAIAAGAAVATAAVAWGLSSAAEASNARADIARKDAELRAAQAVKPAPVVVAPPPPPSNQTADTVKAFSDIALTIAKLAKGAGESKAPVPIYKTSAPDTTSKEDKDLLSEMLSAGNPTGKSILGDAPVEVGSTAGTIAVVAASAGTLAAAAYAAKSVADAAAKVPDAINPFATVEAPKNPSAEHGPKGEPIKGRERDIAPNVDIVPTEPEVPEEKTIFDKAYEASPLAAIRKAIGGTDKLQALHLAGALPRARMLPDTGELIWYIERPSAGTLNPPSDKAVGDTAPVDGCCGSAESDGSQASDQESAIGGIATKVAAGAVAAAGVAFVGYKAVERVLESAIAPIGKMAGGVSTNVARGASDATPTIRGTDNKPSDGPGEPIHLSPTTDVGSFMDPDDYLMKVHGLTPVQALSQGWTQVMPEGCGDCQKPGWQAPGASIGTIYNPEDHARDGKEKLKDLLGNPIWLRGVGIGKDANGLPTILVNVRTEADVKRREIPSAVGMTPVMVRAVGDIAAQVGATQDDVFSMVDAAATALSNAWMPGSGDAISALVRTGKGAIDRGTGHDPGKPVIATSLAQQAKMQEAEINASVAAGLERQAKAQEALALQRAAAETAEAAKALACAPAKRVVREWVARHPILTRALSPDLRAAAIDPCADGGADLQAFVKANPFTVAHTSPDLRAVTGVHEEMAKLPLVKVKKDAVGRMRKAEASVGQSNEPQASGLLIRAIREGRQSPVQWAHVMLDSDIEIEVMGDAMKADVDGQLLRLPVSYAETIEAAQLLGKGTLIPMSKRIADAVYRQSAKLVYNGLVSTNADSLRMRSLAFVKKFNDDIEAQIAKKDATGTLIFGPWKLWILSSKLGVRAKDSPNEPAAINYGGWRANGTPIQTEGTWHIYSHDDYSQLLQFVKRWGTRKSTGGRVDLLAWIEQNEGVGDSYTEPFRG